MNRYENRYCKLIENFKNRSPVTGHNHHILPKSLGGTDDKDNLVMVTLREHYILHLILALWTKTPQMIFAWNMMRNNAKSSKDFETLLSIKYKEMSKVLKGKVSIQNLKTKKSYFEFVDIAKEKVESKEYKYCGSGFVVLKDSNNNFFSIPTHEYDRTIHQHMNCGTFSVLDLRDRTHKKITRREYEENGDVYITNLSDKVYAKNFDGETISFNKDGYRNAKNKGEVVHASTGKVVIVDGGEHKKITKEEYLTGSYTHCKANKVNVYLKDGTSTEIDKDEFHKNRELYTTSNEGICYAIEIATNKKVRIPVEEFRSNKHLYKSYHAGKMTVIDINSGNFVRVTKEEYLLGKGTLYKHPNAKN